MSDLLDSRKFLENEIPRLLRLGDLLEDWEKEAVSSHEAYLTGQPQGPVTNLPKLNTELGGAFSPGLHIVHGTPGVGKTAFALQVAGTCQCPALYITCEMAPLELLRRITARATGTFLGNLKSGKMPPKESMELAKKAIQTAPRLVLGDATHEWVDPSNIQDWAEVIREDEPNLLVIIDSVHSWVEGCPVNATEYEALNAGLATLRALSHKLNCPILAVAERNRASMNRGGLNAGAGTRKIEYGAETVIDLTREEPDAAPDGYGEYDVTLKFAKNRNGAPGKGVALKFHGALQKYREV